MRTIARLAALALALAVAPAARADLKVGFVDFQKAIKETDEGKAASATLKRESDERQKLLDARSNELKKLQEDLQKQAAVLAPDARAKKGAELEEKMMEARDFFMKQQQELSTKERAAIRPLADKMNALVRDLATAEAYTLIFDHDPTGDHDRAGIVFAPDALDLTNEVIRKYNAKFPVARKAEAPAAAPAAAGKK
jgi:outer membrane protein